MTTTGSVVKDPAQLSQRGKDPGMHTRGRRPPEEFPGLLERQERDKGSLKLF
jgi:hypothetical protein